MNFMPLREIKELNPKEVDEFAKALNTHDEIALCQQLPCMLFKCDAIKPKTFARIRKTNHEYGTQVPRNDIEVEALDGDNIFFGEMHQIIK